MTDQVHDQSFITVILLKGKLVILGDFNIHANNIHSSDTQHLNSLLDIFSLKQHVNVPTHKLGNTIDLLCTRDSDTGIDCINVINELVSDHFVVHFNLATCRPPLPKKTVAARRFKSINLVTFKEDIKNSVLSHLSSEDPDELAKLYNQQLTEILDKHAPVKTKTVTIRPLAPWYTDDIQSLRKEVRHAERRWRRTHENQHREEFRDQKKNLTKQIKIAKKAHYQNKISSAGQAQKALFQCVDELVCKTKSTALPSNLPKDEQPNSFKNFFHEKIEKLQPFFTQSTDRSKSPCPTVQQLQNFHPATIDEIRTLIKTSPSKSCPLDPIPTFLLKDCLEELLPVITTISNAFLYTALVPISFKKAVVTPLLKKQSLEPDVLGSYRPVSNLSFISKILEKVVAKRLRSHKTSESLYEPFQSAYRARHSTETAVVRVQNDILEAIDGGKCVFLVLLDLLAAFDTVSHDILLERLSTDSGISGSALSWISSYLTQPNTVSACFWEVFRSGPPPLWCTARFCTRPGSILGL